MIIVQGKKYKTRGGKIFRVLCTDSGNPQYPVVGVYENGVPDMFTRDGRWLDGLEGLTEISEPREMNDMTNDTDIPYTERNLIQRAINNASSEHAYAVSTGNIQPCPRWVIVTKLFCCGTAIATAICYRYGYDPAKMIGDVSDD